VLIKLDENLGERGRQLFAAAGHDVATVGNQGLAGAVDRRVIEVCGAERRCPVTLDMDFSNPFVFPPEQYAGIAVLRPHRVPASKSVENSCRIVGCAAGWFRPESRKSVSRYRFSASEVIPWNLATGKKRSRPGAPRERRARARPTFRKRKAI
jgi:predicted nuclease of predicted toxin-antitoxin system